MATRAATGRAIAIIVGLVLALVAAFLLWRYVDAADERAFEGAELVDVFVAVEAVPEGTTGQRALQQNLIDAEQVPNEFRPEAAVTTLDEISDLAARDPILSGTILQLGMFADPTDVTTDFDLQEDEVAISLQVGIPEGVAGNLSQGDTVGVITHIDASITATALIPGEEGEGQQIQQSEFEETRAEYITDAEILAIGQRSTAPVDEEGQAAPVPGSENAVLVTLAVTREESERLVFANNEGVFHFTLLPEGAEVGDTPGVTYQNLFE